MRIGRSTLCAALALTWLAGQASAKTPPWAVPAAGERRPLMAAEVLLQHGDEAVRGGFEAESQPPAELPPTLAPEQSSGGAEPKKDDKKEEKKDPKKEEKKEEKKDDKPKPKKWYEKYNLRGYTQLRMNEVPWIAAGSAPAQHVGDRSVGANQNFLIRRARIILSGDVSERVSIYLQPDFAVQPPGSPDATHFVQIRDWYADLHLDLDKKHRFRVGQSKVPYGWENMQSSSNRLALDRNDAFNSGTRNERDLGAFYYWTPKYAQQLFKYVIDEGLKGSGNYGVFGFGFYNGQGGSFIEQNENIHTIARLQVPYRFCNGQIVEAGIQGYWGKYTVLGTAIRPLGAGAAATPAGTGGQGHRDDRIGWTAVVYPQPIGFQAEWTIGRGPALNAAQTAVTEQFLQGGYVQTMVQLEHCRWGKFFPFVRWQLFEGGYKSERNAPYSYVNDWEVGMEWQIAQAVEFTSIYTFANRTNTAAPAGNPVGVVPYQQFVGNLMRFQLQFNY